MSLGLTDLAHRCGRLKKGGVGGVWHTLGSNRLFVTAAQSLSCEVVEAIGSKPKMFERRISVVTCLSVMPRVLDITNALVLNVRMRKAARVLGPQELQIMKVVWERRRVTVRDVYEALRERRQIAYTTVMTMMNILDQKGFLKRVPGEDRAFVYEPGRSRQTVMRAMVKEFLDRVFGGSANPLMLHLIQDKHVTKKDLDDLRRAIRKKGGAS